MLTNIVERCSDEEVVSIQDAMEHSRITDDYDEVVVQMCLDAAHDVVERRLNRKLLPTAMVGEIPEFQRTVHVPYPPIQSIDSITAENSDGDEVTLTSGEHYKYRSASERIIFSDVLSGYTNFIVNFTVGYCDADSIPPAIKHAIRMTFATLYENREDTVIGTQVNSVPMTAENIIRLYRVRSL